MLHDIYAQWGSGTNGSFQTEKVERKQIGGKLFVLIHGNLRPVHTLPGHTNKPSGRYFINHDGARVPLTFVEV